MWMNTPPVYEVDRYTFLDVGAGKGRAMLQASLHPFHQVIGIELNPTLAGVTRDNMRIFSERPEASQLAPISLIEGDALAAPLPTTPTVAFLFHPFEAPVLRRFLDRCIQHFAERPGALDILYINAEHASVLDRNPAFTRLFNGLVPMSPGGPRRRPHRDRRTEGVRLDRRRVLHHLSLHRAAAILSPNSAPKPTAAHRPHPIPQAPVDHTEEIIMTVDPVLLSVVIRLIIVGVLLGLVNAYIPMASSIKSLLNGVVVIYMVLWLLQVFHLFYLGSYRLP